MTTALTLLSRLGVRGRHKHTHSHTHTHTHTDKDALPRKSSLDNEQNLLGLEKSPLLSVREGNSGRDRAAVKKKQL